MKKSLLILAAFIVLVAITIENAAAQDQTVVVGSTYNYSVTQSAGSGTSTYAWGIDVGAHGTQWNSAIVTTNTKAIEWLQAGTYIISVLETSGNGCPDPGAAREIEVLVVANNATIQFTNASSADCDGASATNLSLDLTLSGNVVYPLVISYTITVGGVAGPVRTATVATGNPTDAIVALGATDNILDNLTTADVPKTITITGATSHGAAMTVEAQSTHVYTVWGTPATTAITHD